VLLRALYYQSVFTYIAFTSYKIFIASLVQAMAQQSTRFHMFIMPYVTKSGTEKTDRLMNTTQCLNSIFIQILQE